MSQCCLLSFSQICLKPPLSTSPSYYFAIEAVKIQSCPILCSPRNFVGIVDWTWRRRVRFSSAAVDVWSVPMIYLCGDVRQGGPNEALQVFSSAFLLLAPRISSTRYTCIYACIYNGMHDIAWFWECECLSDYFAYFVFFLTVLKSALFLWQWKILCNFLLVERIIEKLCLMSSSNH